MADRTTKVTLTANIAQYVAGMEKAALSTRTLGTAASKLTAQKQAFSDVGRVIFAVGALAAAGVALAIKEFADFDAKMAQIKTLSGATAEEMDSLAQAALHLGQSIGFTATQVADAEIELVKAGVSVKDQLGGALQGALELAAAGQIDVAQATEIATIAMTQFALKGREVPHVADLLAAGADKALGSVGDLGEALKSGGLVAAQFGVSLDETVGTLSAFANAGLLGETAGTDLRQLLLKLANPAADATAAMEKLGISIYDQSGSFVGLAGLAGQLKDKLADLTPAQRNSALATIFGSRAIAGANVLYKEGAAGIAKWTDEVNTSGFAAKQAAGKMDNLNGDITKLQAAFQTGLIESGSSANDVLRGMVQNLTGLVSAVSALPQPVLTGALALTAMVAVVGLVGGSTLLAVPRIVAFKNGLGELGITGKSAAIGMGVASVALVGLGLVLSYYAGLQAEATSNTQDFKQSLDQASGATTKYTRELVAKKLAESGAFDAAKKAGVGQKELTDAVLDGGTALSKLQDKLNDFSNFHSANPIDAFNIAGSSTEIYNLNKELGTSKQQLLDQAAAAEGSVDPNQSAAAAYKSASDAAGVLNSNLTDLIDTINKANGVGQDAVTTNAAYQQGLADINDYVDKARKKVDGYSLGVDENTAAGSKNVAMLSDLAKKNEDAAKAQFDLDGNTTNYVATLTAGRQQIIDHAMALGATADQAQAIADKVAAIPTAKEVQILVDTSNADTSIDALMKRFNTLNATAAASGARYAGLAAKYASMPAGSYASGGYTGDGATTDVAGQVHKREFVLSAAATSNVANRTAAEFMLGGGDIRNWNPATKYSGAVAPRQQYAQAPESSGGATIPVNIKVTGETDPQVFAALAGQGVAARLRGVR